MRLELLLMLLELRLLNRLLMLLRLLLLGLLMWVPVLLLLRLHGLLMLLLELIVRIAVLRMRWIGPRFHHPLLHWLVMLLYAHRWRRNGTYAVICLDGPVNDHVGRATMIKFGELRAVLARGLLMMHLGHHRCGVWLAPGRHFGRTWAHLYAVRSAIEADADVVIALDVVVINVVNHAYVDVID